MNYKWDDFKNISNFDKHSIWFEEAQTVWADPMAVEFYDEPHSIAEDRFIRIGHSSNNMLLMVVFCERRNDTIWIISARRATKREREQYEEGI